MEMSGTFNELPLPELLQFLGKRQTTGCLSLEVFSDYYSELEPQGYHLWLNRGDLVLCQRQRHPQDIYAFAVAKQWISRLAARKLKERAPQNIAAGLYLESQGVLDFGQLRSLFFSEVVRRVETLCGATTATFRFQSTERLPLNDLSGLSIPATKMATQGIQSVIFNSVFSKNKESLSHVLAVR